MQDRNRVLVVDDDEGILDGVERLLRLDGYEAVLFSWRRPLKATPISKG